jgi:hypothetical protein
MHALRESFFPNDPEIPARGGISDNPLNYTLSWKK